VASPRCIRECLYGLSLCDGVRQSEQSSGPDPHAGRGPVAIACRCDRHPAAFPPPPSLTLPPITLDPYAGLPACAPAAVDFDLFAQGPAVGSEHTVFELRTTSNHDCRISGYINIAAIGSNGRLLMLTISHLAGSTARVADPPDVLLAAASPPLGTVGSTGHGWVVVQFGISCGSYGPPQTIASWRIGTPSSASASRTVTAPAGTYICGPGLAVSPIEGKEPGT